MAQVPETRGEASARITRIFLRPSQATPVRSVASATAVAGRGLDGDHAGGSKRQITLLDAAAWADACRDLGAEVDPGARRANVVVDGLCLRDTIGSELFLGAVRVRVHGETRPCELLDGAHPGLQQALRPDRRGGVWGEIVEGGTIAIGEPVAVATPAS